MLERLRCKMFGHVRGSEEIEESVGRLREPGGLMREGSRPSRDDGLL